MNDRSSNRLPVIAAAVVLAAAVFVVLRIASDVTRAQQSGADRSAIYHEALSRGFPLEDNIAWLQSAADLDREPTPATLSVVTTDWAAIWFTIDAVHSNRPTGDLSETLTEGVLQRIVENQPMLARQQVRQLTHELEVTFYALDGAVMGLRATAIERRDFADSVTGFPLTTDVTARYDAVITLIDGRWRLTSLRSEPTTPDPPPDTVVTTSPPPNRSVRR